MFTLPKNEGSTWMLKDVTQVMTPEGDNDVI